MLAIERIFDLQVCHPRRPPTRAPTMHSRVRMPHPGVVAFLFLTRMFIFTKRFSVAHTRSHDHPQLGFITPTDGMVKDVS